jgi:hypothetical protein
MIKTEFCDCLIPGCGRKNIKMMHSHLRRAHNMMTIEKYLEEYPNAEISYNGGSKGTKQSEESRLKRSLDMKEQYKNGKRISHTKGIIPWNKN